jgi:hypothetical protein
MTGANNSDAKIPVTQSDEEEELLPKKKTTRILATYDVVKRWVTGDTAEQPEEDLEQELLEQAPLLTEKNSQSQKFSDQSLYVEEGWRTYIARRTIYPVPMSFA